MDNPFLTSSSMSLLIRTLKAAMPGEEITTDQGSDPGPDVNTTLPEQQEQTTESPEPGGCKSVAGLACLVAMAAAFVAIKKRK